MMLEWMTYLVSGAILQLLFWGIYRLVLNTRGDFVFERYFLLGGLGLSLVIPLLDFQVFLSQSLIPSFSLSPMVIGGAASAPADSPIAWTYVLMGIYSMGVLFGIGRLSWQLLRLYRTIQQFPKGGHKQRMTGGRVPTSSFFQTLLWDETQPLEEGEKEILLAHEEAHMREGHSFDRLFVEIIQIAFWFNPILILLKKDLMLIHEALADRAALKAGNIATLARVLLRQVGEVHLPLIQTFSQPPVDRRVAILTRTFTSNTYINMRMITSLCLIVMVSFFWACTDNATTVTAQTAPSGPAQEVATVYETIPESKQILDVDVQPEPLNYREIQQAIGYPQSARDKNIQGTVVFRILIDEEGQYVKHQIVKSISPIFDEAIEAQITRMRFKPAMKDGQPVQFWVSIPFAFKLIAFDNLLPQFMYKTPDDRC
ncbi:MAG: M56 family metallopeptidase [Bacteroidota bacterium]